MPYLNLDDPMETLKTFIRQVSGKGIGWNHLCNAAINHLLRYKKIWIKVKVLKDQELVYVHM